ncbi:MAG: hypothetical protein ACRDQU_12530 [Pseudonocardiaceae bacterium]
MTEDELRAHVAAIHARQGLPSTVEDPVTLERVAVLMGLTDAVQAPPPRFPREFPAGRRSSSCSPPLPPGGQPDPTGHPKFPAGRRSSTPDSPGGQPDPSTDVSLSAGSGHQVGSYPPATVRWAWCPVDARLHLLAPLNVARAALLGHGFALCGRRIPALGLTHGVASGGPCVACVAVRSGS